MSRKRKRRSGITIRRVRFRLVPDILGLTKHWRYTDFSVGLVSRPDLHGKNRVATVYQTVKNVALSGGVAERPIAPVLKDNPPVYYSPSENT